MVGTVWIHLLPDAFSQFLNPCLEGFWTYLGPAFVGIFGMIASFSVQLIEVGTLGSHLPPSLSQSCSLNNSDMDIVERLEDESRLEVESKFVEQKRIVKEYLETFILEAGILVHSLVIGVTLGVTSDDGFSTLLIAVSTHQLFEGMALGAMIAEVDISTKQKLLVGLLYPLTTPIGIAIGIAIHDQFNTHVQISLILQGVFTSLSSGILLYNVYCELINNEINRNIHMYTYTKSFKALCFTIMYLGTLTMAVLAIWV
ncbi:Zinc/iron permease [Globomyces pollinis-pini]|nr:Zinc/iron permease [Globomyces pollinis-pini]